MEWVPLPACLCHIFLLLSKFLCFCFTSNFGLCNFLHFSRLDCEVQAGSSAGGATSPMFQMSTPLAQSLPISRWWSSQLFQKKSAKRLQSYYCSNISVASDKLFGLNMNSILREIKNEISLERRKTTNFFIRKFDFFRINHCMMCQKGIFRRKKCWSCVQPYPNFPCKICKRGLF